MSSGSKKTRRKKEAKKEIAKELPPQVVTCSLAHNTYSGIIREGQLGTQYLECADAKYQWDTGVTYEGPFVASRIEGKGKFSWPDGSTYEGELQGGKRHGQGVYVTADSPSRYEGQWSSGKRDGVGRLTYNADGTSFYDGGWREGKKHGQGKQVWPSGNSYEGQWSAGKMSGRGKMTWRTGGTSEQYVGEWEDNQPHGQGEHTWHSVDITAFATGGDLGPAGNAPKRPVPLNVQQQMNNRYQGQWACGQRNGFGTFYYGNGACYCGEWRDHMKHGHGRHTFEDGTVYEGTFTEDAMDNYTKPPPAEGTEMVSRLMDICDLDALALPNDRSGIEITLGAGYTEHSKIFREVYNMLMRHLGDLRELYARYRAAIPRQGSDPFTLQSYQLWLFARDAGILTPACPLPRLSRAVFTGPRHHGAAAPEDLADLQPITVEEVYAERRSALFSSGAEQEERAARVTIEASQSPSHADSLASASEASSVASSPASPNHSQGQDAPGIGGDEEADDVEQEKAWGLLGERFLRAADSSDLADINSYCRPILFRQFLEGIVRLAPTRFPHERGIEAQTQRFFKHCILPLCEEGQSSSEHLFSFMSDKDFQPKLKEFESELWELFGRSFIPKDNEFEPFQSKRKLHVNARLNITVRVKDVLKLLESCGLLRPVPLAALPEGSLVGAEVFSETLQEQASADDGEASADENASGGSQEAKEDTGSSGPKGTEPGGLGGPSGKPAMLGQPDALGAAEPPPAQPSKGSRKRDKGSKECGQPESEKSTEATLAELAQCDFAVTASQAMRIMAGSVAAHCLKDVRWELDLNTPPSAGGDVPDTSSASAADDGVSVAGGRSSAASAAGDDDGPPKPRLQRPPVNEEYSVFEYADTEMVFAEFLRVLLQVADLGTRRHTALCERMPLPGRFEAFLRHVFLPALRVPYASPVPAPEEEAAAGGDPSDPAAAAEDADADAAAAGAGAEEGAAGAEEEGAEGGEDGEGEDAVSEQSSPPPPEPELWGGFEGRSRPPREPGASTAAASAARRGAQQRFWPKGYELEVQQW